MRRHAPEEPDRAVTALLQAHAGNLKTNPERAREEPSGTPHATGPGLQKEWPILDVDAGSALSATRQFSAVSAREERARRLRKTLLALLAPQGEALLEVCVHVKFEHAIRIP